MATQYPNLIDSFTNPSGTSTLDNPDHATQHINTNGAVIAIENVLGTTAGTSVLKNFIAGDFAARVSGETLTNPKINQINDTNGSAALIITPTASAVNQVTYTNAATSGVPSFIASGTDTNIHIQVSAKGSALTKTSVGRQDSTVNSYKPNSVIIHGDGTVNGNSTNTVAATITFPITFAQAPHIVANYVGRGSTLSTAIIDAVGVSANANQVSTTGCKINVNKTDGLATSTYFFTYIIIGEL